jgi:hypothetical protein
MKHRITTVPLAGLLVLAACGGNPFLPESATPLPVPVDRIEVGLPASHVEEGQTAQATASLLDASGNALVGRQITWSTSDPAVATVDRNGIVEGIAAGGVAEEAPRDGR